jgi:hypothetical protein
VITDFVSGTDKIFLGFDADTLTAGDQFFTSIAVGGRFSGTLTNPGELYYDSVTQVLYGDVNADGQADFSIALTGVSNLSATDLAVMII